MRNMSQIIKQRFEENKQAFKNYATEEKAAKVGEEMSEWVVRYYGLPEGNSGPDFIVVYVPSIDRWMPVFLFQTWFTCRNIGGYVFPLAQKGHLQQ